MDGLDTEEAGKVLREDADEVVREDVEEILGLKLVDVAFEAGAREEEEVSCRLVRRSKLCTRWCTWRHQFVPCSGYHDLDESGLAEFQPNNEIGLRCQLVWRSVRATL